jgi:hypothetical protein
MSGSTYQNPLSLGDVGTTSDAVGIGLNPQALQNFSDLNNIHIVTFKTDGEFVNVTMGTGTSTQQPQLDAGDYLMAFMVPGIFDSSPNNTSTLQSVQNSAKTNSGPVVNFEAASFGPTAPTGNFAPSYAIAYSEKLIVWIEFTLLPLSPPPISAQSCFRMGTMIETDQGTMKIEDVVEGYNTINNKQINRLTKCLNSDGLIVKLEKGCLGENKPSQDLYMQKDHKLMLSPFEFAGLLSTGKITFSQSSTQEILYNILLDTHETMNVANITVETLNPELAVSKYFMNPTVELKEKIENDTIKIPIV